MDAGCVVERILRESVPWEEVREVQKATRVEVREQSFGVIATYVGKWGTVSDSAHMGERERARARRVYTILNCRGRNGLDKRNGEWNKEQRHCAV